MHANDEPTNDWAEGILGRTPIATPTGWRDADSLRVGDEVLGFDSGRAVISRCDALGPCRAGPAHWPMLIPKGVLDTRAALRLMPEQKLLLECDAAEALWGEPFVLIPAAALEGYRGVTRVRPDPTEAVVRLGFAGDEIVYASRGVLILCPQVDLIDRGREVGYPAPDMETARALVAEVARTGGFAALPIPE